MSNPITIGAAAFSVLALGLTTVLVVRKNRQNKHPTKKATKKLSGIHQLHGIRWKK